jgi:beta-galactosidase
VTVSLAHAATGRGRWEDCRHTHLYTVHPDGRVEVDNVVRVSGDDMFDLPRVGVRLDLTAGFERLTYFGRGPFENYADRKSGAPLGVYRTTVAAEYVDYVMPQEHGHHTDVRWLELALENTRVLRVTGMPILEFNASHFTAEDLYAAKHTTDLTPRAETILHLDAAHRGLGTNSCGPDVLSRYQLRGKNYRFGYVLSGGLVA